MSLLDFFAHQEGKAILPHPALTDAGTPISVLDLSGGSSKRGPLTQSEAKRHGNAYGGKQDAIDYVMNCIRLYTDAAANAEWHLEKKGKRLRRPDEDPEKGDIGPIALYNLLDQPNPFMDYSELISLLIIDTLLVGNAYWYKWGQNEQGQPLALYRLAPPYVKIVPGDLGPAGYQYQVPGIGQRKPLELSLDQVIHFKLPNPHDPYYGLGVIQGGARALDMELALTDHMANYYEKGANPSVVVQSDRRIPHDVFKKLQSQIRGRIGGSKNAGELLVLQAGLQAHSLSPDATKAQFAALAELSRERIGAMFRVHPKLLGIPAADGADKADDVQRVFDNNTLNPFFTVMAARISKALTQAYDVDFKLDHRYRLPKQDQVTLAEKFAAIPGVTVKEVRDFLDLPPTGDKNIDDLVLNLPGDNGVPGATRNGIPDRPLNGEGGRPPIGVNTASFGTVGGGARPDLVPGARARRPSEKKAMDDIIAELEALESKALPTLHETATIIAPEDPLGPRRDAEVDAIIAEMAAELRDAAHELERALLDHVEGKAFNSRNLRSRVRRSEAWRTFQDRVASILERAAQRGLSRAAVMWGNAGRRPEDDIDYASLAKELVYRKDGVRSIVNTQRDRVSKKLGEALEAGGGRDEADAAIRDAIRVWVDTQAETVAATEAVHAFNEGTLTVAEMTGATEVFVQDGHDHDEACQEANGQVWSIEKARENRLEHPRCRRSFVPMATVE